MCAKAASTCPNEDEAQCTAECQAQFGAVEGQCGSQASAQLGCLQGVPGSCNSNGQFSIDISQLASICAQSSAAYGACAACIAFPDDDACDSCSKQSCCNQRKAALGNSDVIKLSFCIVDCEDSACATNCQSQYASVVPLLEAVGSCNSSSCPGC